MKSEVNKYAAQSSRGSAKKSKIDTRDVSNAEIACDAIELILLLYARLENPGCASSIPVMTKVPQLLASITEEKKLAIGSLSQTRSQLFAEFAERMREMCFSNFDNYSFKTREKRIAWLLLTAHSTKEISQELHISEATYRYAVRQMCKKTRTATKDDMVTTLREGLMKMQP